MTQAIKIDDKDLQVEDGEYALVDAINKLAAKIERLSMVMA